MKLIDILLRELPARGGWPSDAKACRQFDDGEICFSMRSAKSDFYAEWATDVEHKVDGLIKHHVTREQYEAAFRNKPELSRSAICDVIYGAICKADRKDNRSDEAEAVYDAIAAGKIPGINLNCSSVHPPIYVGLEEAAKPLIKWIAENCNPHSTVIVDGGSAVLYSAENSVITGEFIKD